MAVSEPIQVVCLTPAGRGAIATLLVRGDGAEELVEQCFAAASRRRLSQLPTNRIVYGRWLGGPVRGTGGVGRPAPSANARPAPSAGFCVNGVSERASETTGRGTNNVAASAADVPAEDVVVCRTGVGEVEIHCHGGVASVRAITDSLVRLGCVLVGPEGLPAHSELGGIEREAFGALLKARTERTAAMLLDQYLGRLRDELSRIKTMLEANVGQVFNLSADRVDRLGTCPASCAHSAHDSQLNAEVQQATARLRHLASLGALGTRLVRGWRVVVTGRPNVGKSSLVNAIVGFRRALVFDQPGTTRDVVTAAVAIDGWPVEFCDTAGIRRAEDPLEAAGVAEAWKAVESADLLVWVSDATQPWSAADVQLAQSLSQALYVRNKVDLVDSVPRDRSVLCVSAKCGTGLGELVDAMMRRLVPYVPPPAAALPFSGRQCQLIQQALECCQRCDFSGALDPLRMLLQRS